MDDGQIEVLAAMLKAGRRIAWRDPSGPLREILSISWRGDDPPEPAGNFGNNGEYCALWAVCSEDVLEIATVFPSK